MLPATASELLSAYRQKTLQPVEVVEGLLRQIDHVEPKIKAFAWLDADRVKKGARHHFQKVPGTISGQLEGVPVAIKDNICVQHEPTTCASKILTGFRPPYDATVIERLRAAGAILFGKTNMDEFAFGSSTESSGYHVTRNPWDLKRIPGGSSGGSAAALAADEVILALGSDTGGSIRQPAALCGIVGMKPTYGRVSRYGLIAFASSLDQIGPMAKNVRDCARLLQVIAGYDPRDSTSANTPVPEYLDRLESGLKGLTVGLPKEYFIGGIAPDVEHAVREAVKVMERLGAKVIEIALPHTAYAIATYYLVACSEASSNLARFDGVQYGFRAKAKSLLEMYESTRGQGFGAEVKRRIILGTYALSKGYYDAYYLKAMQVRTLIKRDFDQAFERCQVIVTPTSPTAAFKIGEKMEDPLTMYLSDIYTIAVNLAGIPALSLPCGFTKTHLPIGLQLMAKPFDEATIFRAAAAYERETPWHERKPKL